MDIVSARPDHVDRLLEIYRAQTAHVPHCRFEPNRALFHDEVLGLVTPSTFLWPQRRRTQVFVAEAAGVAHGFASLTTYVEERDSDPEQQAITSLFFDDEAAAHALILACEAHASGAEIGAFPPTHGNTIVRAYNGGWDGLTDTTPTVARILVEHRYAPYFRELNLTKRLQPDRLRSWTAPPAIAIAITEPAPSEYYPWSLLVLAMDGETEAGVCCYSDLAGFSEVQEASRTGYIWWLNVIDTYQRRGIARALMLAALDQLMMQGCDTCWLTTTADNWPAQSLYLALGFEFVDGSTSYSKVLRP